MLRLPLSVLAIIVFGAVMSCGESGVPSPTAPTPTPIRTVFPPRPDGQLTMCVDTVEATKAFQSEAVELIRTAMVQVMQHPMYGRAYTSGKEPIIDSGCPAPPALYEPAALYVSPPETFDDVRGRFVDTPGFYAEAVYVIPDKEIDRYTRDFNLRLTSEERRWSGDVAFPTTDGLYLSPADFDDIAFLVDALEKHTGLEDPFDPGEPGYHPEPGP